VSLVTSPTKLPSTLFLTEGANPGTLYGSDWRQTMKDDSLIKKFVGKMTDKAEEAFEAVADTAKRIRERLVGMEVTFYPTYGYREGDAWLVPVRVWVHDNRDTPFVEDFIERKVRSHFEVELGRPLTDEEAKRLEACLENFIADDKHGEQVEFTFEDDPDGEVFRLANHTTHNGVIEETLRLPAVKIDGLLARETETPGWLKISARTADGNGAGEGSIRFLAPGGVSIVSDIDDTIKVTQVPAGKKTVLRNTFLKEFKVAEGMLERYLNFAAGGDVSFHYVSGSPWQLFGLLEAFLVGEQGFPAGTFHMKNLGKNIFDPGGLDSIKQFVLGGDLATLDQKIRQITNLMLNLSGRKFILIGDSGEKDPEVFRAIRALFPERVLKIYIRDVLGERLEGMERITGADVPVALDTSGLVSEMKALIDKRMASAPAAADPRL
jgi:hypothetical protein